MSEQPPEDPYDLPYPAEPVDLTDAQSVEVDNTWKFPDQ